MPIGRSLAVALMVLVAWARVLPAATLFVYPDGTGDFPTIQAAVDAAAEGDTVALADGIFTGTGNKNLDYFGKAITVCSQSGDPATCVIECEYGGRGFYLHTAEGPGTRIEYITVAHGQVDQGGAAYCSGVEASFTGCVFLENRAWDFDFGDGGAVESRNSALSFTRCSFMRNSVLGMLGHGGGVACWGGELTARECGFTENSAGLGGGGGLWLWHLTGNAIVEGCVFRGDSQGVLGCISSELAVSNCLFVDNHGEGHGTAMYFEECSPSVQRCTFARDSSGDGGSGVECFNNASPTIRSCTFYAMHGSVIRAELNSFPVLETTIIAAADSGQAVECVGTSGATLACCDLYGNAGGDWVGCIADQYGVNGNFSADPLFCDPHHENLTLAATSPCAPENSPGDCGLIGAWPVDCEIPMGLRELAGTEGRLRLGPILPTPAPGQVRILCIMPRKYGGSQATIDIHDPLGRCVRRLRVPTAGSAAGWLEWDGRDGNGMLLPSGAYFCRPSTGGARAGRRIVLIR